MRYRAAMNYVAPTRVGAETAAVEVPIHDGRKADLPGWEVCGFELMPHRSAIAGWDDEAAILHTHYAEMEALARDLTRCDFALVTGHILRNPEAAARHADLGPISFVHSDFAASYGDLIRRLYQQPEAIKRDALQRAGVTADDVIAARRLLILQFWRNVGPSKMDLRSPSLRRTTRTATAGTRFRRCTRMSWSPSAPSIATGLPAIHRSGLRTQPASSSENAGAVIMEFQVAPISTGAMATLLTIVALALSFALFFAWIAWGAGRMAIAIDDDSLHLRVPLYGRSIALASLDLEAAAAVHLSDHAHLTPRTRTNGIGLPGMAVGWFRLRDGSKALMAITDRHSVLHLPTREGYAVLVSTPDAATALDRLRSGHAMDDPGPFV